jgi:hypothetical protein
MIPNKTFLIGLGLFIAAVVVTHLSLLAGRIGMLAGFTTMFCAGAGAGLRALLAEAHADLGLIRRNYRVRRRLWLRRVRQTVAPSAIASLAWQCGLIAYAVILVVGGLGFFPSKGNGALVVSTNIFLTIALIDLAIMGFRVMAWPWGKSAGKWLRPR